MRHFSLSKDNFSVSRTVESGAFVRTVIRKGRKRKQKTIRLKKNQKKVVLGHVGDFEVYVYPYDYPDTVFMGTFPISTKIELSNVNQLISAYNKTRSFLNGDYFRKPNSAKGTNSRRQQVSTAYSLALKEKTSK